MKVCLVRCPSAFLIDERAFPPLGLMSVGAGLRKQGHEVVIYDGELFNLPLDYSYYGFGPTSPEYPYAVEAMQRIHDNNPNSRVILGGPHATLTYWNCATDGWDCIVVGDGEIAAEQAFLSKDHLIFAEKEPLDSYPFADRSLVDLSRYHFEMNGVSTTTLMSSRGCPFSCGFCCKNHTNVRMRGPNSVIQEIKVLERLGFRGIAFPEDIFILSRSRTQIVCDCLKRRGIIWRCLVRADLVVRYGDKFLETMKDSGCVGVGIGIESGSDTILKAIGKGESISTMVDAVRMIQRAGIYIKGFFIVGLPGENEVTLAETDNFLREAKLDDIDCKIFQPYPGSPIYDHKERYDIQWEDTPLENTFYKGRPAEYHGNISTSRLTTQQIVDAWKYFEITYKNWDLVPGGLPCET
jgi:radical SAM superfamily enzyme YgiQ (UPF0313 family)